jgi:large subunit ribosomal protein L40
MYVYSTYSCKVSNDVTHTFRERIREVAVITPQVEEERALLCKEWTRYKNKQHMKNMEMIDRLIFAQQKALDQLRQESEELYQAAIEVIWPSA